MRFQTRMVGLLVGLSLLGVVPPASADTIDQSFTSNPSSFTLVCGSPCFNSLVQSFTAGLTGTLTGVNINILATSPQIPIEIAFLQLSSNPIGNPSFNTLGSTTVLPDSSGQIPLSTLITFPQTIAVVAGQTYGIRVQNPADNSSITWSGDPNFGYGGGIALVFSFSPSFTPVGGSNASFDFNFQTHVNTAVVPEPGTLALLASGLAAIGLRLRRRE